MTEFASQYERNSDGVILIPEDGELRKDLFVEKVSHPAKNNLLMLDAIAEYLTPPGGIVLDPMAGAGSTMYVARTGRKVWLIELEPKFIELLEINRAGFIGDITIFPGDCLKIMPFPACIDLIMFSPPYSDQLKAGKGAAVYEHEKGSSGYTGLEEFTAHPDNLSKLTEFWFNNAMKSVYKKCLLSLKPGGYMAIIIKDRIKGGKRVELSLQTTRMAIREGFTLVEWHKHEHVGKLWGNFNLAQGYTQVTEEDILFFRRAS